jgi:hypothetical protein
MKEKIILRLKAKFSGLNLSNSRIDAIADKLAAKITDENLIDARLDELNEISPFSELAKYDDWQRTKAQKEAADQQKADKEKADKDKADKEKSDSSKKDSDKDKSELQQVLAKLEAMDQKVRDLEAGKQAETHISKLRSIQKEKSIPDSFYEIAVQGRSFKDDAEVTAFADNLVKAYEKFYQEKVNTDLKDQPVPAVGGGGDPKKDVSPDMQAYIKDKQAAVKKSA